MEDKLSNILDDLSVEETTALLEKDINLSMNSFSKRRIMKSVKKKVKSKRKNYNFMNEFLGGFFMKRKLILGGLMLGTIMAMGAGGYAYASTPVAYVSLDINPSVELGVNRFDQVVSVEGYNEDGKNILENTDLKKDNVNEAVGTLVENAIDKGYVTSDNGAVISLTTATDNASISEELKTSLKDAADKVLDNNNIEAEVEEDNVALQRRDEARKLGITPGKLNLIQKLQALDSNIKVEDYKDLSVKEIQKKAKELRKDKVSSEENNNETNIDSNNSTENSTSNEAINESIENKNEQKDSATPSTEKNVVKEENAVKQDTGNSDNNNRNKDKEFNPNKPEKQEENNSSNSKNNNSNKSEQKENDNSSSNSQGKNSNKK